MGRNAIETILGAVVVVVAASFILFAYTSADLRTVDGYTVSALFPMVDGLKDGSDVKMNGVKVGSISSQHLVMEPGPNQYLVDVTMTIDPSISLPTDTIAMIASESLMGGKYMSLEVGVDEEMIEADGTGRLTRTQPPMRLDDLIGQMIYSKKAESTPAATPAPAPAPAPAAATSPALAPEAVAPAPAPAVHN